MGRRKAVSGKLKKAQLQHSRAVKHAKDAGEAVPAAPKVVRSHSRQANGLHAVARKYMTPEEEARYARKEASLKIESRFLKLPGELIEYFRTVLSTRPLARPIDPALATLSLTPDDDRLTCPKRPKWSYNSSKEQVEKNEEGLFRKWLEQTDDALRHDGKEPDDEHDDEMGHASPSFFERNLNVWRQLWRVTEQSDILLVLADVRFPLLHLPPSLRTYLATCKPRRPVVIVLTKTDLVPPDVAQAWKSYLGKMMPDTSVVLMRSYREAEASQANQIRFVPEAPEEARQELMQAIKTAHQSIIQPPEVVQQNPDKLARWKPRARVNVDWDTILPAHTKLSSVSQSGSTTPDHRNVAGEEEEEHAYLTLGLIGQPNVGKSSLLNALLRRKVVRASKTPGKTKTFQTIFLNPSLRLVDCPGLVCPAPVGFEQQVLGAIIPIQHVEAVLHLVGERMSLEKILSLQPDDEFALEQQEQAWTTDTILASYATQQGFITAKAGRPDLHRAGSQILRQLHSGAIAWAYLPPIKVDDRGDESQGINSGIKHEGIWLSDFVPRRAHHEAEERDDNVDEDGSSSHGDEGGGVEEGASDIGSESEVDSDEGEEEEEEEEAPRLATASNAFAALSLANDDTEDDDSEE